MVEAAANLSDDQAAVYDRQLRVWGVHVQNRLNNARVLMVGGDGLAAEIAKNIVLAGVGNVSLMDPTPVASRAPGNFLIAAADASSEITVAEASARTLQGMNPLIKVSAVPGSLPEASSLSQYDVVVATGLSLCTAEALDAQCNEAGSRLFLGQVRGPNSYVIANLHQHTYTEKDKPGEKQLKYASVASTLAHPLCKTSARTHPLFAVLKACHAFEKVHGREPSSTDDVDNARSALQQAEAPSSASGSAPSWSTLQEQLLASWVEDREEFAPVCAVVGGVVANNIIRAVSHVNAPLHNCFFYCLHDGTGMVECLLAD